MRAPSPEQDHRTNKYDAKEYKQQSGDVGVSFLS